MKIIAGPLSSKWNEFVKLIVAKYPIQKTSTIGVESVFLPLELTGKTLLGKNSIIYVSTQYQMNLLSSCIARNPSCRVAVSSIDLQNILKTREIPSTYVPFNKYSEGLDSLFREEVAAPEPVVVKRERKKIAYTVNATYQLEHLFPLIQKLSGDIIVPENQFAKLQGLTTLAHTPILDNLNYVPYPEGLKVALNNRFVISTGIYRQLERQYYQDSLYICHGISDKESYHSMAAKSGFKFYASSGPRFTELYKKYGVHDDQIIKCGYLRSETPYNPYEEFDVLFAPTHGAGTILPYVDEIIKFCTNNKLSLRIRLHPLTESNVYNKCRTKIAEYLVPGDVSTWSLLHSANYVITDVSSVSYEALLLDKPVMMLEGQAAWTQVSKKYSAKFGPVVKSGDTNKNKIETCFNSMLDFNSISKDEVFYLNESPSTICVDFIKEYLGE